MNALKIGYTKKNPEKRAAELSKQASTPSPLHVLYSAPHSTPKQLEKRVHWRLKKTKLGREFFKVNLFQAVHIIVRCSEELNDESLNLYTEIDRAIEIATKHENHFRKRMTIWQGVDQKWVKVLHVAGYSIENLGLLFGRRHKTVLKRLLYEYPLGKGETPWGQGELHLLNNSLDQNCSFEKLARALGRPTEEIIRRQVFLKKCKRYLNWPSYQYWPQARPKKRYRKRI